MTRILLLQGPMGPFFNRLKNQLIAQGHEVYKVHFNGGDSFFYKGDEDKIFHFYYNVDAWPAYLKRLIEHHKIDLVLAYGDCRIYNRLAKKIIRDFSIPIYFFEEGYLRPNYITLEEGGVNANSKIMNLSRIPYTESVEEFQTCKNNKDFYYRIIYSILYYGFCLIRKKKYPCYQHHRSMSSLYEGSRWINSLIKKYFFILQDRCIQVFLKIKFKGRFYLIPLQIKDDAQIRYHSNFNDMNDFIEKVLTSFSRYSPTGTVLVIKHHPMDRGHSDYSKSIKKISSKLKITKRVFYIRTGNNPSLLRDCRGVVTINSTMGLSALVHSKPVIALGRAIYARPKLTYQGKLNNFWHKKKGPSPQAFQLFLKFIRSETQIVQSFYKEISPMSHCLYSIKELNKTKLVKTKDEKIWSQSSRLNEETSYAG